MEEKEFLTPAEVIKITGLSKNAVYQALNNGQIPAVHIGDRWLIPVRVVEKMRNGEKVLVTA